MLYVGMISHDEAGISRSLARTEEQRKMGSSPKWGSPKKDSTLQKDPKRDPNLEKYLHYDI